MQKPSAIRQHIDKIGAVDRIGIEDRVAKYCTRSIKKNSKDCGLKFATWMVDLTNLEGNDTAEKIAFTGSTNVGRSWARPLAGSGKRLTLEYSNLIEKMIKRFHKIFNFLYNQENIEHFTQRAVPA